MSGQLSTTLTESMEAINVKEKCKHSKTTDRSPPHITPSENSDDAQVCELSAEHIDMETEHSASESDSSPEEAEQAEASAHGQNDVSVMREKKPEENNVSVSPVCLKRKCLSLDVFKLRKQQLEEEARAEDDRERRRREAKAANGAGEGSRPGPQYFVKDWEFVQTLGEGAYGEVKLAYNSKTQEAVAVKIISTRGANEAALDDVRKEICIHRMINHPNIVRYYGMRKEGDTQYLFLQYASGGELFDRIEPDVGMPQADAQKYFRQLIDGLEYLHSKGITHRDIKPENLLLDNKDNLKIADFGLATVFRHQGKWRYLDRLCGSAPYLAPEVISCKPYRAEPADIWSSGVVLVAMLVGELPWDAAVLSCSDYVNWRECHIENRPWNKVDNLALCLLRRLLTDRPEKRYTIEQIRKNQWFKKDFSANAARQLSDGPKRRRTRISESEQSPGAVSCSQPTMTTTLNDADCPQSNNGCAEAFGSSDADGPISFSQPAQADDMLLSSQLNATQSSQTPMQKLVRRMTRFFCKQSRSEVMEELSEVFSHLDYSWKHSTTHVLTVHTVDRRQSQLTFKVMILEMGENLLVDFRLSKGDGLEFKRHFMRIREMMKAVICKVPSSWPSNV